jgi:hypothetical protein
MPIFSVHGFHRLSVFLSDQKGTKESPGTHVSRSLLHFSGHPVAGVGVFDLVTLPSWQRLQGLF